jgi:hypothetical protein
VFTVFGGLLFLGGVARCMPCAGDVCSIPSLSSFALPLHYIPSSCLVSLEAFLGSPTGQNLNGLLLPLPVMKFHSFLKSHSQRCRCPLVVLPATPSALTPYLEPAAVRKPPKPIGAPVSECPSDSPMGYLSSFRSQNPTSTHSHCFSYPQNRRRRRPCLSGLH